MKPRQCVGLLGTEIWGKDPARARCRPTYEGPNEKHNLRHQGELKPRQAAVQPFARDRATEPRPSTMSGPLLRKKP